MSLLFLNSISGGEILVILLIVLMLFGSDSIPKIARTFGKTIRQFKDASQEIQRDIQASAKEATKEVGDFKEIEKSITKTVEQSTKGITDIGRDIEKSIEEKE